MSDAVIKKHMVILLVAINLYLAVMHVYLFVSLLLNYHHHQLIKRDE